MLKKIVFFSIHKTVPSNRIQCPFPPINDYFSTISRLFFVANMYSHKNGKNYFLYYLFGKKWRAGNYFRFYLEVGTSSGVIQGGLINSVNADRVDQDCVGFSECTWK